MKAHAHKALMKRLAGILLGVASASALISLSARVGVANGNASSHQLDYSTVCIPSFSKGMTKQAMNKNIIAVAYSSAKPSFKILITALKVSGLTETLAGTGPFTVFAPTDDAFNALPKGTLQSLLKPENKAKLIKILTYHILNGKLISTQLKSGLVTTVEGSSLQVTDANGRVMVNGASITRANILASNGVIHAINKVVLPPGI